ncbi:twin-arginine translocation signal domain-containing protein [Variovorax sp. J22R133]|uniref:twin-arginine translocation signal domain-containing protein n=1 Tax=Variovorax brevis TaxID=3053503 RepID=UPI002576D5BB|nr:twin-arginine translocation signal domain-containing protein [Variovorax sp. J22R133]MDM0113650.1 twin-arginine translocation signal domain-containing protein [Variovorax sp. J22R133]
MRVIPIEASVPAGAHACHEDDGQVPRLDLPLARREFLKGSGILMGTLAAGSVLATLAPSSVWALELQQLNEAEGKTLMAMGRVLYPHKKLPDAVYALLVKDLDGKAEQLPMLRTGMAGLDQATGGSFVSAAPAKQLAAVKAIEGTPFFNTVRGQCVTSLYNNDMAFAVFGYPGSSWEKGGYITRGFQDLKWLPAPPQAASPPPYIG